MRKIIISSLALLALTGCATPITITKQTFPAPPAALMVSPVEPQPVVADKDGTLDPASGLTIIVSNDIVLRQDEAQLKALQAWITATEASINKPPK